MDLQSVRMLAHKLYCQCMLDHFHATFGTLIQQQVKSL